MPIDVTDRAANKLFLHINDTQTNDARDRGRAREKGASGARALPFPPTNPYIGRGLLSLSRRQTRAAADTLALPQCRKETYKRSFRYFASDMWNKLPTEVRLAETLTSFNSMLYSLLLDNSNH